MTRVTRNITISDILINPNNPRFDPVQDQDIAIKLMLEKEGTGVKHLAGDIAVNGLNPTKNPAVLSQNGKYLTLEGNRRIVALKLLNDPNIATNQESRKFFHDLKINHERHIPNAVPCVIFETEDDAHRWISLEHTGQNAGVGIKPWNPIQKDRFLKKSSRKIQIFEFADKNNINRDKVDATNVERLVSTPYVCEMIGVSFPTGKMRLEKTRQVVKKNFSKIFRAMAKKEFRVGDIYTSDDRKKWIDTVIPGSHQDTKDAAGTSSKTSSKSLPKSTVRKHLIPNSCELIIKQNKTNDIFIELKDDLLLDSSMKSTPNAVAVLFRVFLEASLHYYLQRKRLKIEERPSIVQMIEKVTEHMEKNNIATASQLKHIRRTSSGRQTDYLHINMLHEYVHSGTTRPEADGLKAKWDNLQEFFEILWNELSSKKG